MTTIILNAEAVNALFPEGTEARVELQNTVLRKLATQFIKEPDALKPHLEQVKHAAQQVQLDALKEMGITKTSYSGFQFNQFAKDRIKEATQTAVGEIVSDAVRALDIKTEIGRAVDQSVEFRIRDGVRARLAEISKGI